jgi:ABC-type Fe3+-hydroxamate transport system substrate-binding protein
MNKIIKGIKVNTKATLILLALAVVACNGGGAETGSNSSSNGLSFTTNSIHMLNKTHSRTVTVKGTPGNIATLSANSGSLLLSADSCSFTPAHPTCSVDVTTTDGVGSFIITANSWTGEKATLPVTVHNMGDISFDQTNISLNGYEEAAISLKLNNVTK